MQSGEPAPAGLDGAGRKALAWALKDLCYAAWNTEPQRAARAAEALARLSPEAQAGSSLSADAQEVAALAAWTAGIGEVTRGRMAEAVQAFDQAAALFQSLGQAGPAAQTQVPKIMALAMLGRHADAAACAEATQQAFVAQGDVRAASKVSLNLGSLHLRHDAYADAARHYRDAARLFARVGDREHSVMADIGLADALTALGELDEAQRIYARARVRSAAHGLPVLQALVDNSLALLDLVRGRYGPALAGFESARQRYEQLGMPQHLAIAEQQLADAYLELRLLPEALALYQQAQGRFDALAMPDDSAWTWAQRGRAKALLGRTDAAASAFETASALFETQQNATGRAAVALARAELALAREHDAAAALAGAREARLGYEAVGQAEGQVRAEVLEAEALLQAGRVEEARALFTAAGQRAVDGQMLSLQGRCLSGLGRAAQAAGDEAAARPAFEQAVALFEEQRQALPGDDLRSAFLTDRLLPYRELLRAALRAHEQAPSPQAAAEVLQQHERVRARALGERLARAGEGELAAEPADPETQDLRARFNWLYRRARSLQDEDSPVTPALGEELRRTERELLERARRARLTHTPADTQDPAAGEFQASALCAALGEDEALLEYGVLDDELFACIVTRDGVGLVRRLASWPEVLAALRSARFQIETLSHGAAPLTAHLAGLTARCQLRLGQVHQLIWAPLATQLSRYAKLLIVAPAQLGGLPFAALHDAAQPPGRQALAQRHRLAFAPSARTALRGLRRQPCPPRQLLVLAESSRLVHAGEEATEVASLFDSAACFIDSQATLACLREQAGRADLIHLACHARFRSDNPSFSALHLHDGALTAELAETLPLRPGIVVLSGCETGLADGAGGTEGAAGDEMVGLVRAFLVAGAARVLASLWPVDDAVTRLFMQHFYTALREGRPPAEALGAAQATVMQRHPHPFYWAAFALYGGW